MPNEVTTEQGENGRSAFGAWPWWAGSIAGLALFAVIMFLPVIGRDTIHLTTDDSIGILSARQSVLPAALAGAWQDLYLVGWPVTYVLNWTNFWLMVLPIETYIDCIHGMNLLGASLFLLLFLRGRGVGWPAAVLGVLTAYWVGTNFTLSFAGHIGKYAVLLFASLFLFLIDRAAVQRSALLGLLAGGALGFMYLEQADFALFFSLGLGPYALFALWREHRFAWRAWLRVLSPMLALAALLAVNPLLQGYTLAVKDAGDAKKSPQEAWEFATQWSWPPTESISFVAPGYKGWRTGEPTGPYWGKMGRSAGWEPIRRQGFQNFKLEAVYLGGVPVALACWVCMVAFWARREGARAHEILFWGVAGVVFFLLSCGKYLPFYRLLYLLPAVGNVRNPNKFLQLWQVMIAILAAFGLDALFGRGRASLLDPLTGRRRLALAVVACAGLGLLVVWWLGSVMSADAFAKRMVGDNWGQYAETIVQRRIAALGHGVVMGILAVGILATSLKRNSGPRWLWPAIGWCAVAVVAVDAKLLSRHYVDTMSVATIADNPVLKQIESRRNHQRVALPVQADFYNTWLTYDLAYHGVPAINVTAAPRMQQAYRNFLGAMPLTSPRTWEFSGVQLVLAPGNVWGELQSHPATKDQFQIIYAFNTTRTDGSRVTVTPATEDVPGEHCVLQRRGKAPRFVLVDSWETVPADQALSRMATPAFTPLRKVLLEATPEGWDAARDQGQGPVGTVTVRSYRSGRVSLKVSSESNAILRIADRYHPNWKATLNRKPVEIVQTDYLYQGVPIPAGIHEVDLEYESGSWALAMELACLAVWAGAAVVYGANRRRARHADGAA